MFCLHWYASTYWDILTCLHGSWYVFAFLSCVPAAVNLLDLATAAKLAAKQQQPQQQQPQPRSKQDQQQQLDEAVAAAPALKGLAEAGLSPVIPRCMAKLGFNEPTPIQAACWGPACAGKDVLGHAEPGWWTQLAGGYVFKYLRISVAGADPVLKKSSLHCCVAAALGQESVCQQLMWRQRLAGASLGCYIIQQHRSVIREDLPTVIVEWDTVTWTGLGQPQHSKTEHTWKF